jgi:hypothetical protein
VSTRDLGDAVEICIRNNGTGIPVEIKDKLFQPFFTTKPTGEGTGLGLSISYDIVTQQHGGTIEVGIAGSASSPSLSFDCPALTGRQWRRRRHECEYPDSGREPDVADLFRQRFRRETRQGLPQVLTAV